MEVMALIYLGVLSQVGAYFNKYKTLYVSFSFCFENQYKKSNLDGN